MPYSEALADRIRSALADTPGLTERKMFGGVGWMINGNMAVGAHSNGGMIVRCALDDTADYCEEDGCNPMVQGGRPMRGWLVIDAGTLADAAAFQRWLACGRDFAQGLPPK